VKHWRSDVSTLARSTRSRSSQGNLPCCTNSFTPCSTSSRSQKRHNTTGSPSPADHIGQLRRRTSFATNGLGSTYRSDSRRNQYPSSVVWSTAKPLLHDRAVRWYLRFGLSYRDVAELLAERGIEVDHVTVFRWVQRFTPLLADAARPCRHAVGDRWYVDETHVKVAGRWRYVYRAIDQYGQVQRVTVRLNATEPSRSPNSPRTI
jgi:DDE domain